MSWGRRPFWDLDVLLLALAAVLLIAGCGASPAPSPSPTPSPSPSASPSPTPSPVTIDLSADVLLTVPSFADFSDPTDCAGGRTFTDLHSGADVIVTDAAGVIVGTAPLSKGVALADPTRCRLSFRVHGLLESPSYNVRIGRQGPWALTLQDVRAGHITFLIP
jgi:hypothetical protein